MTASAAATRSVVSLSLASPSIAHHPFFCCRSLASQVLTQNLFILNDTFQPSLLKVRELCVELSQMKLHQIRAGSMYSLEQFVKGQEIHKQTTCEQLDIFFDVRP